MAMKSPCKCTFLRQLVRGSRVTCSTASAPTSLACRVRAIASSVELEPAPAVTGARPAVSSTHSSHHHLQILVMAQGGILAVVHQGRPWLPCSICLETKVQTTAPSTCPAGLGVIQAGMDPLGLARHDAWFPYGPSVLVFFQHLGSGQGLSSSSSCSFNKYPPLSCAMAQLALLLPSAPCWFRQRNSPGPLIWSIVEMVLADVVMMDAIADGSGTADPGLSDRVRLCHIEVLSGDGPCPLPARLARGRV